MSRARDLNEAFEGRFNDVYIFKSSAIEYVIVTSPSIRLVDTVNLAFVIHEPYHVVITNFGDYQSNAFQQLSWGQSAITLSTIIIDFSVQKYVFMGIYEATLTEKDIAFMRIGSIVSSGGRSPYLPAAISVISLTEVGIGIVYSAKVLQDIHEPASRFEEFLIPTLSCRVLCDVLISVGMVYYLLSSRTQFRRTNSVLNLLAIYAINCGTLHLVFTICCVTLLARYRDALIYIPFLFIMIRLSLCAFMSILNSRDNLRETLDGPEGVVATFTQPEVRMTTTVPRGPQDTTEASTNTAVPKSLPRATVSFESDTSFSDSVIAFDREKYPVPPVPRLWGSN
ncbi:hypothetical protein BJY52DRAFT_1214313 [Lactarius psammicola]|nr:hypothetical protein BJY52DRAFT_1214313 [Lactarius psammicola]